MATIANSVLLFMVITSTAAKQHINPDDMLARLNFGVIFRPLKPITACKGVQTVVKANSKVNGKGQISTPCGSETRERISMKPRIYYYVAGTTTHANSCGAATTCVSHYMSTSVQGLYVATTATVPVCLII